VSTPGSWMPVFLVHESATTVDVELSAEGKVRRHKTSRKGKDHWARIGTARSRPDGGFSIRLNAVPLSGVLIIRPAQAGEFPDPTQPSE
jgi:hypothetical protein